jgi:hypothetical protein
MKTAAMKTAAPSHTREIMHGGEQQPFFRQGGRHA